MKTITDEAIQRLLNKVPAVTLAFWIIKVLATTVGETAADFLSTTLKFGLSGTSYVMGTLLVIALVVQVRGKHYVPWIYWLSVVLISVVGTLITDNLVEHFGVTLTVAATAFALALAATFTLWYASERTLSIHSIYTRKREIYYWLAILFTFALGTASGDLLAEGLALGYAKSALLFAAIIALVTFCHYFFKLNAIFAFWIAYIVTRPLGASLGDLLSQPLANGGLGLGTAVTSGIFLTAILALVIFLSRNQRHRERRASYVRARNSK